MTDETVSSDSVAADQLRAFIERIERMEEEKAAISDDIKEIYAEAKGNGFDTKVLHQIVRIRKQDHSEREPQRAIVQHLRLLAPNAIWWHTPNGEHRSKRTGARLKALGVQPGVPDLCFVLGDGTVAFMELKRPGGRLSPEQRAFEERCTARGVPHCVIADLDSALAILLGWGVLP
jgi:uncharacterized protein (UPF0335 family)